MERFLIILLAAACLFLLLRAYTAERNLRSAARQLREVLRRKGGGPLRLETPNPAAEELMEQINPALVENYAAELGR